MTFYTDHGEENSKKIALFWEETGKGSVKCLLCPHSCIIAPGERGCCMVRENIGGKLFSLNYGFLCTAIDPIEKKPLFHWKPGSYIFSVGSFGCNLFCPFCQNAHLARAKSAAGLKRYSPESLLALVLDSGTDSVAFTYNEPSVWLEFVLDASRLLKKNGISTVIVTNGFLSPDPLDEILKATDALNIDLKGFSRKTYSLLGGSLEPVLNFIVTAARMGIHLEITHLVVPDINVSIEEFRSMVLWIKSISPYIPLHISRFFPAYKWNKPPTRKEVIAERVIFASKHLHYVYSGNLSENNSTLCENCGRTIISRNPFNEIQVFLDQEGKCPWCNTPSGIVMR